MVNVKAHAKELMRGTRERWQEAREEGASILAVIGIGLLIVAVPVAAVAFVAAYALLVPGLVLMVGAWACHQVWDVIPALGYWASVAIIAGLRVLAWLLGRFLRWIILAVVGGSE